MPDRKEAYRRLARLILPGYPTGQRITSTDLKHLRRIDAAGTSLGEDMSGFREGRLVPANMVHRLFKLGHLLELESDVGKRTTLIDEQQGDVEEQMKVLMRK